jgi:hypothetical protein
MRSGPKRHSFRGCPADAPRDEFAGASGKYFGNDAGRFASPHADALDPQQCEGVVRVIEAGLAERTQ